MSTSTYTAHDSHAINSMGLWLFIVSETALFSAFIFARYYLTGTDQPSELNIGLGYAITAVLLSSSLLAYGAERRIAKGDRRGFLWLTLGTIVLGTLFLVGVGLEWREAAHAFAPPDLFGVVFFSLTGLHATHMVTGLIALCFVWLVGWRGGFGATDHWGVTGVVRYWHFVDAVWLTVFPTLYLV